MVVGGGYGWVELYFQMHFKSGAMWLVFIQM
jgi:hypothetical protein